MLDTPYQGTPDSDIRLGFGQTDGLWTLDLWGDDSHYFVQTDKAEAACDAEVQAIIVGLQTGRPGGIYVLPWDAFTGFGPYEVCIILTGDDPVRFVVCLRDQLSKPGGIVWSRTVARAGLAAAFHWAWTDRRQIG